MIEVGTKGRKETTVTTDNTALAMGSGTLEVFATPAMCALMEAACAESITPYLADGQTTVGTALDIKHLAASPVGIKVWAVSTVADVDRKAITFSVEVFDEAGKIGEGTHGRFIVESERFLGKAQSKLEAN